MQDAIVGGWTREPQHGSVAHLSSLHELNLQFLELVAARARSSADPACAGIAEELADRLIPLSAAQRAAAARCPYALFDLRFQDDAHWQRRLRSLGAWGVADEPDVDAAALNFVQVALFYAWHVAATANLAAQVLLGMSDATAGAFRLLTVDRLPGLAASELCNLTARWSRSGSYWNALTHAAIHPDEPALRRAQLHGLQLAAASRLYSP